MTTSPAGTLPAMDVAGRLPRLRAVVADALCDTLVVSSLVNIRYLTGFTGSAATLVVLPDGRAVLVTDGRYAEQAADEVAASRAPAEVEIRRTIADQERLLADLISPGATVGLEALQVSWAAAERYRTTVFPGAAPVATDGLVEGLRMVKDDGEVARIEAAATIADDALAAVRPRLGERPTERQFALELDHRMRTGGADDISFPTIVGSGPNGARPHAHPGNRTIGEGDLVVLDFGALVDGYHSDMTRTVMVGEPSPTQARMLEVVGEAQAAGVAAVAPGTTYGDVDAACRSIITSFGWADAFVHPSGHAVGLDIHEWPRVASGVAATLAAGHVVTVEPGVYLPEHGGVRIEDTVVVTPDGCRRLTRAPKATTL